MNTVDKKDDPQFALVAITARLARTIPREHFEHVILRALRSYEVLLGLANRLANEAMEALVGIDRPMSEYVQDSILRPAEEIVCRSCYIVAWANFENLFTACVRAVFLTKPELLNAAILRGDRAGPVALELTRGFLMEGLSRDEAIGRIVDLEVSTLHLGQNLKTLPGFCKNRLGISISEALVADLTTVLDIRVDAAHEVNFRPLPREVVSRHMHAFVKAGLAIADACIEKHAIPTTKAAVLKDLTELDQRHGVDPPPESQPE